MAAYKGPTGRCGDSDEAVLSVICALVVCDNAIRQERRQIWCWRCDMWGQDITRMVVRDSDAGMGAHTVMVARKKTHTIDAHMEDKLCPFSRFTEKRLKAENYKGKINPKPRKRLDNEVVHSREWTTKWAGESLSAIFFKGDGPEDYISNYYTIEAYRACYAHIVNPINGENMWPTLNMKIAPPTFRAKPGRPKKLRRREADDPPPQNKFKRSHTSLRCGKCNSYGHNKRTCKNQSASTTQTDTTTHA
ncbi:hypothetical protein SESBI_13953 [Sesbania bispinosa]|nr:hypothetical protein SESBI_13953 [Sesbania bispinosa]